MVLNMDLVRIQLELKVVVLSVYLVKRNTYASVDVTLEPFVA